MQDHLFIAPSLPFLRRELEGLVRRFGIAGAVNRRLAASSQSRGPSARRAAANRVRWTTDQDVLMSQSDFPLRRIDHVRFFVGNARQSAYFYRNAFGFDVIAYAGLETQDRARGRLRPAAGRHHLRPRLAARPGPSRKPSASSATATACRTSPWKSMTCAPPTRRPCSRGAIGVIAADAAGGRVRRLRVRHHPRLRRHDAHLRQPRPLPRRLRARLQAARPRPLQPAAPSSRSASRPSTTSSATSRKARWTSGCASTRTCWASRSWSASTTRTSARNTRP